MHHPPRLKKSESYIFTLIELLVVIAIIAILASLLLPSLSKARARGKAIKCAGNMKQIYYGLLMYASDFNAYYPPNSTAGDSLNGVGFTWGGSTGAYTDLTAKYMGSAEILRCPSDTSVGGTRSYSLTAGATSEQKGDGISELAMTSIWPDSAAFSMKVDQVRSPGQKIVAFEFRSIHNYDGSACIYGWNWYNTKRFDGKVNKYHDMRPNYVWADGHVQNAKVSEITSKNFLPKSD